VSLGTALPAIAWRRSPTDQKLAAAAVVAGTYAIVKQLSAVLAASRQHAPTGLLVLQNIALCSFGLVPVAIGFAVLRYRLYEIDGLISRTITYAFLTATLAGVFFGIVAFASDLLSFSSPVAVAVSPLAVAALFNPLRVRLQRLVDRRFNRARYDAEATVATFAARLRDAVDLDTVRRCC
jgi:hypothetical protein